MRRGFGHRPHSGFPGRETFPAYGSQSVNTTGWLLIEASGDKPKSSSEKGQHAAFRCVRPANAAGRAMQAGCLQYQSGHMPP